jgi:hypothetical protein
MTLLVVERDGVCFSMDAADRNSEESDGNSFNGEHGLWSEY